jgi:hypothetical protein
VCDHLGKLIELLFKVKVHQFEESVTGYPVVHHINGMVLSPVESGCCPRALGLITTLVRMDDTSSYS